MILSLGACSEGDTNFSQYPGFDEHYELHPRSGDRPSEAERDLLHRHRPHLWLPDGHEGPIDFYRDYMSEGVLIAADGREIPGPITPGVLNEHRDDLGPCSATGAAPLSGLARLPTGVWTGSTFRRDPEACPSPTHF